MPFHTPGRFAFLKIVGICNKVHETSSKKNHRDVNIHIRRIDNSKYSPQGLYLQYHNGSRSGKKLVIVNSRKGKMLKHFSFTSSDEPQKTIVG